MNVYMTIALKTEMFFLYIFEKFFCTDNNVVKTMSKNSVLCMPGMYMAMQLS